MFPTKVPRVRSPRRLPSGDGKKFDGPVIVVFVLFKLRYDEKGLYGYSEGCFSGG